MIRLIFPLFTECRAIRFAGFVCILLCLAQCSNRSRNNPLDPRNPETHGRPSNLRILSDRNQITLSWDKIDLPEMRGYPIYRRTEKETLFECIGTAGPSAFTFMETVPYDQEMIYKISALTSSYESPPSDSASITAGPYNYWIADYYWGSVIHLTYDCLHEFSRFDYFLYPAAITADSTNRSAYFLEEVFGYIWKASLSGTMELWQYGLIHPTDIKFDNSRRILWVCNNYKREIVRFDMDKTELGTTSGFGEISDLCLSLKDGGCWIVDTENESVVHLSLNGRENVRIDNQLDHPSTMDCHPSEGWIWIADSLKLVRADSGGEIENTINIGRNLSSLSIDPSTGNCWAAVRSEDQKAYEIWKISPSGEILVSVEGFVYITAVASDPFSGGCLVTDPGTGRIVRISGKGKILSENRTLYTPWDIAVE